MDWKAAAGVSLALLFNAGCSNEFERQTNAAVAEIRSIQAEHTAAISEMRSDLRVLTGKTAEIENLSRGKTQELERSLQRLGSRVPPPPGVPEDLLAQDDEQIASRSGAAADLYKQALGQLRSGDIEEARRSFQRFVEQNPGTAFTDNGLFWLGICYTKLGQYDRAVVSFTDVFQKFPAEDMVPAALFYLADAFSKAGMPQDAELSLQKLAEEYPKSSFAARARARLAETRRPSKPAASSKAPAKKK